MHRPWDLTMDTIPDSFTIPQVALIAGVPQRKIISFIERGYVKPSIQEASGHGSKRLWNYEDALRCTVVAFLIGALSVMAIRFVREKLMDDRILKKNEILCIPLAQPGSEAIIVPYWESEMLPRTNPVTPVEIKVRMDEIHRWVEGRSYLEQT